MRLNENKQPIFDHHDLAEFFYKGIDTIGSLFEDSIDIKQYNELCVANNESEDQVLIYNGEYNPNFHNDDKKQWLINTNVDIEELIYSKCRNDVDKMIVEYELSLYKKNDIIDILKMIYGIVQIMEENNITWGVGRGSSVSSLCLYLLGVHLVDPVKYGLDIHEFIR